VEKFNLALSAYLLRSTTNKGHRLFSPLRKSWLRLWVVVSKLIDRSLSSSNNATTPCTRVLQRISLITGWAVALTCYISHSAKHRKMADFDIIVHVHVFRFRCRVSGFVPFGYLYRLSRIADCSAVSPI